MYNIGKDWPDEIVSQLAEQIRDEIDALILQELLSENKKFTLFLNPPDPVVTDQLILDWYKSLIGIK